MSTNVELNAMEMRRLQALNVKLNETLEGLRTEMDDEARTRFAMIVKLKDENAHWRVMFWTVGYALATAILVLGAFVYKLA